MGEPPSGRSIANAFLATGLILGAAYAYLTPPLRAPDEAGHFFRAYTTSTGVCVGPPAVFAPVDWRRGMEANQIWIELPRTTTPAEMVHLMHPPENRSYGEVGAFGVSNVYNCAAYLPAAMGVGGARFLRMSPLGMMYAGRAANLAFYLLAVYAALLMLPGCRLLMAAIAVMPMALHQAASLSADSPTIALACLFVAYVLRLAFTGRDPLTRRQFMTLALFAAVLGLSKALAAVLPVLLVVPAARFRSVKKKWLWVGMYIALAVAMSFGWQWMNRVNVERVAAIRAEGGIVMGENLRYALTHPIDFGGRIAHAVAELGPEYLSEFVGRLGWLTVALPAWLVWAYLAILLAVTWHESIPGLSGWGRVLLAALPVLNAVLVFLTIWTFETQTAQIATGSAIIAGVQGRYFLPFAFPMFASISGSWLRAGRRWLPLAVLCVALTASSVALAGIWKTYYSADVPAETRDRLATIDLLFHTTAPPESTYEGRLVRRSGASAEDQRIYVVLRGRRRWVVNPAWIPANGYKWPEDVTVIPAGELAAIPSGEPIVTEK